MQWNTTGITVAGATSMNGNTLTLLDNPSGIVLDSSNALYIADTINNRIQKYVNGILTGTTAVNQTSSAGCSAAGYMFAPLDVGVNSNFDVYVVDSGCERVRLRPNGATSSITVAGQGK